MRIKARFHLYLYFIFFAMLSLNACVFAQTQTAEVSQTLGMAPATLLASSSDSSSSLPDLPDSPEPQSEQSQSSAPLAKPEDHTHINPIALLSPHLIDGHPLTNHDKFEIYMHKTFSPAAVIFPLFGSAIKLADPNGNYPPEWQDGMGALGRNYGNAIATRTSSATAVFATDVLFHEDPRYGRSTSTNGLVRLGHAIGWTFVDKSDSGHSMLALSTFTGAAAGSFVGMAYLPYGFGDAHHAETRMLSAIGGKAVSNALVEFEPQWGPIARKLRIPRLLPGWWVPEHN